MRWNRDQIKNRPKLANAILLAGAIVHFALCWPLFGRRGFPELHPIYLSMAWMWVPAIPLSALYCHYGRRRFLSLLLYLAACSFTVSWAIILVVPSHKTLLITAVDALFIAPSMFLGVASTEILSRLILSLIRDFPPEPLCDKCGYAVLHLREPSCPECGTPFDSRWLDPEATAPIYSKPAYRTTVVLLFVLACTASFPFTYAKYMESRIIKNGHLRAQNDWQNNEAFWYYTPAEESALPIDVLHKISAHYTDPETGLMLRRMWSDWATHQFHKAYREEIERILIAEGMAEPLSEYLKP